MNNTIFKVFMAAAVAGVVAISTGCHGSNGNTSAWDPDSMVLPGETALPFDNLGTATDGNRSLVEPVYFAYDSSSVNPAEGSKCEQVASYIKQGQYKGVIVEGHADERGSREYNQSLGERRALAVRDYLIRLGVDASCIHTKSFGEEQPADPGHNETAWQMNRRAAFAIY